MSGRVRVLVLINSLGPYGAENFVLNHVRNADLDRFDVHVAHMGGAGTLAEPLRAAGAEVHDLREAHRLDARALARLAHLVRRLRVDILQTHVAYAGVVGRVMGRVTGVPVIVSTEQTVSDDADLTPWMRRAMFLTFGLADANVFISDAVRRSFAPRFPDRAGAGALTICNGIDARGIAAAAASGRAPVRRELGIGDDDFAFVNVARLFARKGQRFAIEALAQLRAGGTRASLWLIGAGVDEADLRALAGRLDVSTAVHFLGQRLDVARLLGAFDAYVHPALIEGLGVSVLEAIAAGLPVVATRVGGIPELVRDGESGWLVAPGDGATLAASMAEVVASPDERRVRAARGQVRIVAEHDIRASVAAYEALYIRLLESKRCAASRAS